MNVLDAARVRIARAFSDFDRVLVAFSCGKDSGVLLNLAYDYARETGQLSKLAYYYQDYEAGYRFTHEYAERTFRDLDGCERFWLCLPIAAACSVSMYQPTWIPWDGDARDIWVRPMPKGDYVAREGNCPFPFAKGTGGFQARIDFARWFSATRGRTAVLIGLRADESLSRRAIVTSSQRKHMHEGLRHSKTVDERTTNFYPLYDWRAEDIWTANARFGWDYNKIYDLYYQAGLSVDQMRVASPFHKSGQAHLRLFKVIDPDSWGRMVGRVNGVNFAGIYGGTTAMGWKNIAKPAHFTWKQYAGFLLRTLPHETRRRYCVKIKKSRWHWRAQGGARSAEFIAQLERQGFKIRRTGAVANRGLRRDELVYIDEMMDDFEIGDALESQQFRKAPTWKRVCITILKNDTTCLFMGFQRTKQQNDLRKQALEKYAKLAGNRGISNE